ncbi:MAG: hypothetical protein ACREQ5_39775, partial [Candidatus Dormibacteria bacterium]
MKDSSMDSNSPALPKGLFAGTKEPPAKLFPSVLALNLLIVLKVITDDQPRTFPPPLTASDLLLCA